MKSLVLAVVLIAAAVVAVLVLQDRRGPVTSFAECEARGGMVQESYPAKCTIDGQTFDQEVPFESENVNVDSPYMNSVVTSPLTVKGEAKGTWFFEASMPIEIRDANGSLLGQSYVMSAEDWMTTNFVSFEGTIEFDEPTTSTGTLVVRKDNPSGLPENDDSVEIPVRFE